MSRRRYTDRSFREGRSERDFTVQSYRSERVRGQRPYDSRRRSGDGHTRFKSELDRDFAAMKRVWQMLRYGAVRMIGEVGRQY